MKGNSKNREIKLPVKISGLVYIAVVYVAVVTTGTSMLIAYMHH
jgi:hypothetical protein